MVVGMIKKSLASFIDPRRSPGSQVHAVLQEHIVKGHFLPGQALSEMKLAEELGVSRTPVREALIKLSEDGLVNIVPQSGTYVSPIDVAAVYDSQCKEYAADPLYKMPDPATRAKPQPPT